MDDLKIEVKKLSQVHDHKLFDEQPPWTSPRALDDVTVDAPSGHGIASSHWDVGFGSVTTWTNVPVGVSLRILIQLLP